jgi:hypothetical protein
MTRLGLVVTTIQHPTLQLRRLIESFDFHSVVIVGDLKTPTDWSWPGARYLSVEDQLSMAPELAKLTPWNTYARKNLGYLACLASGATVIFESDDDNGPIPEHGPLAIEGSFQGPVFESKSGWINPYRMTNRTDIWPRGLPLDEIQNDAPYTSVDSHVDNVAVQQWLAAGEPDVDAIYRLTRDQTTVDLEGGRFAVGHGSYTPFNSQSTAWHSHFELMYLPATVSFRMTDIWRSFVALRVMHSMDASLVYMGPGVHQDRNPHDFLNDFESEIPGYRWNGRIRGLLDEVAFTPEDSISARLRRCYEALVSAEIVDADELTILDAWCSEMAGVLSAAGDGQS